MREGELPGQTDVDVPSPPPAAVPVAALTTDVLAPAHSSSCAWAAWEVMSLSSHLCNADAVRATHAAPELSFT